MEHDLLDCEAGNPDTESGLRSWGQTLAVRQRPDNGWPNPPNNTSTAGRLTPYRRQDDDGR